MFGSQQQPGARGIEPVDPRQIEGDPFTCRQRNGTQLPVEFGRGSHDPFAGCGNDERPGLFRFDECDRKRARLPSLWLRRGEGRIVFTNDTNRRIILLKWASRQETCILASGMTPEQGPNSEQSALT